MNIPEWRFKRTDFWVVAQPEFLNSTPLKSLQKSYNLIQVRKNNYESIVKKRMKKKLICLVVVGIVVVGVVVMVNVVVAPKSYGAPSNFELYLSTVFV